MIQVVTCMAEIPRQSYYCHRQFFASLKRFGVEPLVLGQPPYAWQWGGLASKAKFLKRAIAEGFITAEHIIFTDSFDVVYADAPAALVAEFLVLQGNAMRLGQKVPRVIWGAEKSCFSDGSLASLHPPTESSYKYLNSGWGMGETSGFREALDEMNPDEQYPDDYQSPDGKWVQENDQNAWMRQMLFGTIPIAVDSGCALVQNLFQVTRGELGFEPNGRIRNIETNSLPMVWHWNGPSKTLGLREPILKHLGL